MSEGSQDIGKALERCLESDDGNITEAIWALSGSVDRMATALHRLGTNNAATEMGAVEMLGKDIKEGLESIAQAIDAKAQQDG